MLTLSKIKKNEFGELLNIYDEVRGHAFCVWDDEYPTMMDIENDYQLNNLYVLKKNQEIIGALSIVDGFEFDSPNFIKQTNCIEIARVVIKKEYQHQGYSYVLLTKFISRIKKQSYHSIHLGVEINNIPALKLYKRLGFKVVDQYHIFDHDYKVCELVLLNSL